MAPDMSSAQTACSVYEPSVKRQQISDFSEDEEEKYRLRIPQTEPLELQEAVCVELKIYSDGCELEIYVGLFHFWSVYLNFHSLLKTWTLYTLLWQNNPVHFLHFSSGIL